MYIIYTFLAQYLYIYTYTYFPKSRSKTHEVECDMF